MDNAWFYRSFPQELENVSDAAIARRRPSGGQNWPVSAVFGNALAGEANSLAWLQEANIQSNQADQGSRIIASPGSAGHENGTLELAPTVSAIF